MEKLKNILSSRWGDFQANPEQLPIKFKDDLNYIWNHYGNNYKYKDTYYSFQEAIYVTCTKHG